jgi:pyruvate,water dikinase
LPAQRRPAREHRGAKAVNLESLQRKGFSVPAWGVVEVDVFRRFAAEHRIAGALGAALREVTPDDADAVADRIRRLVTGTSLTAEARAAVAAAYRQAGGGAVAVRSSSPDEDGTILSFAGQFDTFLDVTGLDEVCSRVRDCWASAFSGRALRYRLAHGLVPTSVGLAVIVQAMVPADKSGVLFTADPVTGSREQHVISATRGLGDALMAGTAPVDTVHVDAATGAARPDDTGCLDEQDIAALHRIARDVGEAFAAPQDVEWAIAGDRLWLVQCRPITTPVGGERRIWDNSNIIESFGGLTSPLTYTFAADVYARVYGEYARALLLPHGVRRQLAEWLPDMLGYFHGRVYYNLLHWYRMVRLVPGYRLNRKVLEVSLGVQPLADEIADGVRPYRASPLVALVSGAAFAVRLLTIGRSVRRFCRRFDTVATAFAQVDYDGMPCDQVYRRFRLLQRELVERWGPMMILDATLLTSVGVLHLLTRRWLPAAPDWFFWAAAGPGPQVESTEPVTALRRLAAQVHTDPELAALVLDTPPDRVRARLAAGGRHEFLTAVDDYVSRFGFRGVDELKLETPDLTEDPSALFAMLREAPAADGAARSDAADYLDAALGGIRRLVYDVVRRKVAAGMADRERLRWRRARAFGMAKRMLRAVGRDLAALDALDDWRDVFLLRLDEVRGCCEGTIAHTELKPLVRLRREQRLRDERLTAPARFETRGVPYWRGNLHRAGWGATTASAGSPSRVLRGTPSSPGVVEGTAVRAGGAGILLAHHTDPGSVAGLSSASALLVERGSPLTHVAVVARELGIPTVVQVSDLLATVRVGARLRVDGGSGLVEVLEP